MNKIKVIELLNMISKDEEVPKKIKYKGIIYEYSDNDKFYYTDGWSLYRGFYLKGNCLDEEIEIIEEKKIPEKLSILQFSDLIDMSNDEIMQVIKDQRFKINEIIDYFKSKGE